MGALCLDDAPSPEHCEPESRLLQALMEYSFDFTCRDDGAFQKCTAGDHPSRCVCSNWRLEGLSKRGGCETSRVHRAYDSSWYVCECNGLCRVDHTVAALSLAGLPSPPRAVRRISPKLEQARERLTKLKLVASSTRSRSVSLAELAQSGLSVLQSNMLLNLLFISLVLSGIKVKYGAKLDR